MDTFPCSLGTVYVAKTVFEKTRGVIGREELLRAGVFVIPDCNWVHGFFLRKHLYIYFLDDNFVSVRDVQLAPNSFSPFVHTAHHVIESGRTLDKTQLDIVIAAIKGHI